MESFSVYIVAVALLTAAQGETGRTVDDYSSEEYEEEETVEYSSSEDYEYPQIKFTGTTVGDYFSKKHEEETVKYKYYEYLKKTVGDFYRDTYRQDLLEYYLGEWHDFEEYFSVISYRNKFFSNRTYEAIKYSHAIHKKTVSEFLSSMAKVTLQSVAQEINDTCGEYADWWKEIRNKTCVVNWAKSWLKVKLEKALELTVKNVSRECSNLHFCTKTLGNCTLAHVERFVKIMNEYVPYLRNRFMHETSTLTDLLIWNIHDNLYFMLDSYRIVIRYHESLNLVMVSVPTIEPFKKVNLFLANVIRFYTILNYFENYDPIIKRREQVTWGIIRSSHGSVDNKCSAYKDGYTQDWFEYYNLIPTCFEFYALESYIDLIRCLYKDQNSTSLTWSTVPSAFFHSPCLCLAYKGTGCGVKAPKDVDPLLYCLSVLLRDFQRQISFRPAVTYLDYSLMTRVPICEFSNLLQEKFYQTCKPLVNFLKFYSVLAVQCSFDGLVNDNLNCSKITVINTYNASYLCSLYLFMNYVNCEGEIGDSISFYSPGDSSLVLVLTYVDVSVRLLTLVTYLSCPQLRNLPGKLLIGYQVTALLRLLVVRACLEDLALAVRLDVAFDLSSTLWLTSYLHFLTSSIKTLRLPDSLTPEEARMVLLRYSLLGWALPVALSASFFTMDEAIESHVQFGQILFVLCNYAALLWNLYMFYHNCLFYYDVKKNALSLKPGVKASTVFTGLFNFALKTSVLSGMGITIRLIFTQIHGLEELLGYYHAFGTLQGLLVFFLYGCNREARDFWRRILCVTLRQRFRRQNTVV